MRIPERETMHGRRQAAFRRLHITLKGIPADAELEALWAGYLAGDVTMPDVLARLKRRAAPSKA